MEIIPPALALLLPLLVAPLAGWLVTAKLPQWTNMLIVLAVIFAAAVCWAIFAHTLTGDVTQDIMLISAYIAALMAGPLKPLYGYTVITWPSPIAALSPPETSPVEEKPGDQGSAPLLP